MGRALLAWFRANKRSLPWRAEYDPYGVWIAEVMLQQTQMERGVGYWLRWMAQFPHSDAVADAPEEALLHAWEGLGYYRRVRFIHSAAKAIQTRHGGLIPADPDALSALPGLGAYTVAAIRAIAFQHDVVAVDANVERVFSRLLNLSLPPKKKEAAGLIRDAAENLLPPGQARDYNQALMELGALICKKTPLCPHCPLEYRCASRRLGQEKERPVKEGKTPVVPVLAVFGVLWDQGRALLCKRPEQGLWGGLWEFPGAELLPGESPAPALQRAFSKLGLSVEIREELGELRHSYTKHRLKARFFRVETAPMSATNVPDSAPSPMPETRLVDGAGLKRLAMPAHHRKMADKLPPCLPCRKLL